MGQGSEPWEGGKSDGGGRCEGWLRALGVICWCSRTRPCALHTPVFRSCGRFHTQHTTGRRSTRLWTSGGSYNRSDNVSLGATTTVPGLSYPCKMLWLDNFTICGSAATSTILIITKVVGLYQCKQCQPVPPCVTCLTPRWSNRSRLWTNMNYTGYTRSAAEYCGHRATGGKSGSV